MLNSRLHLPVSRQVQDIKGCLVDKYSSNVLYEIVQLFRLREKCEMIRHFVLLNQNNASSSSGLLGCRPLLLDSCSTIEVIFQMSQTSSKFIQS